jgi:hypothetical protein
MRGKKALAGQKGAKKEKPPKLIRGFSENLNLRLLSSELDFKRFFWIFG